MSVLSKVRKSCEPEKTSHPAQPTSDSHPAQPSSDRNSQEDSQPLSSTDTKSADEEIWSAISGFSLPSTAALNAFHHRLEILEDRFKMFQKNLIDDGVYQSDVTDLTDWLAQMENKIAGNVENISLTNESDVDSGRGKSEKPDEKRDEKATKSRPEKPKKAKEEAVAERLEEEAELKHVIEEILFDGAVTEVSSQVMLSAPELQATNEKLKNLALTLNEQLHSLRDKVFLVDHELKRMAKGVEFALMRAKAAGTSDMVSHQFYYFKVTEQTFGCSVFDSEGTFLC